MINFKCMNSFTNCICMYYITHTDIITLVIYLYWQWKPSYYCESLLNEEHSDCVIDQLNRKSGGKTSQKAKFDILDSVIIIILKNVCVLFLLRIFGSFVVYSVWIFFLTRNQMKRNRWHQGWDFYVRFKLIFYNDAA